MNDIARIAMWSGPRNISTAMMRAFGARADCHVLDEPFYAAFLACTGLKHPMRAQVLASQPNDWRDVVTALFTPPPDGRAIHYQKHMTHHMLAEFALDWTDNVRNAFLIRAPEAVLASYAQKHDEISLDAIGLPRQAALFERVAQRLGRAPPVIDARDVRADPRATLSALCAALAIPFDDAMLAWPPGRRDTDGVWAPAWYDAVERSTGFDPPRPDPTIEEIRAELRPIAEAARPLYDQLARHKLS